MHTLQSVCPHHSRRGHQDESSKISWQRGQAREEEEEEEDKEEEEEKDIFDKREREKKEEKEKHKDPGNKTCVFLDLKSSQF